MYEVMSAVATAWSDSQVLLLLLLYPLFLFLGVFFLLALVQDHGSVTAAASAVVRKLASFSISYIYFGRPMSTWVVAGAVLVFSSVGFKAQLGVPAHVRERRGPAARCRRSTAIARRAGGGVVAAAATIWRWSSGGGSYDVAVGK